jgi:hypothetical protein
MQVPTLIAVGDEDGPASSRACFLKRTLPHAGLWVCRAPGTPINLEEPECLQPRVAAFFASVERGAWV